VVERARSVAVHPVHFWNALESFADIRQYQVVHESEGIRLRLMLEGGNGDVVRSVREEVAQRLHALGVESPSIRVELVSALEDRSSHMGKWKNIVSNTDRSLR
jgi:hypothetical protein